MLRETPAGLVFEADQLRQPLGASVRLAVSEGKFGGVSFTERIFKNRFKNYRGQRVRIVESSELMHISLVWKGSFPGQAVLTH